MQACYHCREQWGRHWKSVNISNAQRVISEILTNIMWIYHYLTRGYEKCISMFTSTRVSQHTNMHVITANLFMNSVLH